MKLIPIIPKGFAAQMKALPKAVKVGMRQAAEAVKADYETSTATWDHGVTFTIAEAGDTFTVGTDDTIYGYVDRGTRAHVIAPRHGKVLRFGVGGSPKTRPGQLRSGSGSAGSTVVIRPRVNHPGTAARGFTKLVAQRWKRGVQPFVRKALEEALH